jgi:hypothetical protein
MLKMKEEEGNENPEEPLQKEKKPRTEKQKEATKKMLLGRMEAKKVKNEIIAPLEEQIKSIKKSKPKDVIKPTTAVEPKIKQSVKEKEPEEEEEEEIVIVKKKKPKKKVIYLEEDDDDEEEVVKPKKKQEIITPQIVPNKYVIKFI